VLLRCQGVGGSARPLSCLHGGSLADFVELARVVTWNGRGFDLPVLRLRAMMHGLSAEAWFTGASKWDGYAQRYAADWHRHPMDQLSDYGACRSLALQDVAVTLGLPSMIGGHGAEVAAMIERGELEQVRAYCEADCLNLFVLYVRWALLTGKVGAAGHNASLQSLVRCLEEERGGRPHLGAFLDRWRASSRPMPMFVPDDRAKLEATPVDGDKVA
jgi:predicted PolB exonuclease-like 3'-5' exonuclease